MVARSLRLWQEYERRWNLKLFFRSGALRMAGADDSYESAALPVLKQAGIRLKNSRLRTALRVGRKLTLTAFPGVFSSRTQVFLPRDAHAKQSSMHS
jgi:hypothetical protein